MVVEKYGSYTFNQNDQYSKRKKVNVVLVPNQIIVVHWHPRNKKHLESKGYNYTHMGDSVEVKLEDVISDIIRRDEIDSNREFAPLVKADDAIEIDTTGKTIDDVVEAVVEKIQ